MPTITNNWGIVYQIELYNNWTYNNDEKKHKFVHVVEGKRSKDDTTESPKPLTGHEHEWSKNSDVELEQQIQVQPEVCRNLSFTKDFLVPVLKLQNAQESTETAENLGW